MSSKTVKKQIATAVHKATPSTFKPPKEKHVRRLCLQTFAKDDGANEELIRCLYKRLDKDNWAAVLKALHVFHRLFRDGDPSFLESLKTRSAQIFALRRFTAIAPQGNVYTLLVRKYAKYLEEKVSVLRLVGFQFEKNRDACKDLSDKDAFKRVPKLQSQLNALLNCKMRTQHIGKNLLLIHTYMLLLKDSLVLYPILNDGVIGLIDRCFKMRKKEAQRVLEIYTLFVKETDALIALYDVSRTFARHLPDIHRAKTTLIDALGGHIAKLPDDHGEEVPSMADDLVEDDSPYAQAGASHDMMASQGGDDSEEDDGEESSDDEDDGVPQREPLPFALAAEASGNGGDWFSGMNNGAQGQRNLVHTASFANLAAQPQQARSTTAQGWAVFDDAPPALSSSPGRYAGAQHPQQQRASVHSPNLSFGTNLDADGFDSWATDFSGGAQHPQQQPSYQQKADSIKGMLGNVYQSNSQTQIQNPFASDPYAGNQQANPFLSAPFGGQQSTPTPVIHAQTPQSQPAQAPAQPFNPFL